ncbi:MAG TPA: hypothetical protein VFA20_21950 [Myxococcaceae bacterium]|nr:hypothetical protein [Myxococcaceae bacterium]
MSQPGPGGNARPPGSPAPQNTVFRRPCFQIAVQPSGEGAQLGVQVVAAPKSGR